MIGAIGAIAVLYIGVVIEKGGVPLLQFGVVGERVSLMEQAGLREGVNPRSWARSMAAKGHAP